MESKLKLLGKGLLELEGYLNRKKPSIANLPQLSSLFGLEDLQLELIRKLGHLMLAFEFVLSPICESKAHKKRPRFDLKRGRFR